MLARVAFAFYAPKTQTDEDRVAAARGFWVCACLLSHDVTETTKKTPKTPRPVIHLLQ